MIPSGSRPAALRRILCTALAVQFGILVYHFGGFFTEMFGVSSRIDQPATPALAGSVALLASLVVSARLWSGPGAERFAIFSLTHIAAIALLHYAVGLAAGRLFRPLTEVFMAVALTAGVGALLWRRGRSAAPRSPEPPPSLWDAVSMVVLATLLVPTIFPYIHCDAQSVWACRAFALEKTPSFDSMAGCSAPTLPYPPVWSILLWLGIEDPVFQGRLLAWLLLPLFALFFRSRLARVDASLAPPVLLFTLVTVQVWRGAATYYANVPLMIFLVTGSLLVLGLPRRSPADGAPTADIVAGTICLCAAVLMRADGLYYLAVVAAGAAWVRIRWKASFPVGPFLIAAAAAGSWMFRPAALRTTKIFLMDHSPLWRSAGATAGEAVLNILLVFLYGWQGLWLSHYGFGVLFYLLAGLAIWRWRRAAPARNDTRFFGLVSLGFILALIAGYMAMPFVGDVRVACGPGMNYLECYLHNIRTGLGRYSVHLYPILVLWALSVLRDDTAPASAGASEKLK